MVPNGWLNTSIDDNISFSGGAQPPREVFKFEPEEGYIRLIQIRDYKTDKFVTYVPEKLAKKFCTVDDVMIGRYGPPIFQILRGIEGAYNVALIKAIPKDGVDKEFMYYFLKRDPLLRVIESYSQRTSGQTGIEMDVLKAYPMHLPPLPEQRKIAKTLSTWDKAISTTEKLIETSKQQKKALMQQLLTGKKRLVNPETGKVFEGEWQEVKLNQIAHITMGSSPKSESYNENGKGLPLLQGNADIKSRKSAPRIYTSQITKECEIGDILLSVRAPVGSVAKSLHNACIGRGIAAVQAKKNVEQEFLYQWLLAFEPKWERFSQGSTFEAVNSNDIKTLHISTPRYLEQQRIASVLTAADKEIEVLQAKLTHFKQEKKALMQQLLTGKRRVHVE